ncbi:hypothetical protein E2P81_ATG07710 [Venturia nashicola]|nr:hypothetical protein E2P81_ATG07710 [Venturia nashicola]
MGHTNSRRENTVLVTELLLRIFDAAMGLCPSSTWAVVGTIIMSTLDWLTVSAVCWCIFAVKLGVHVGAKEECCESDDGRRDKLHFGKSMARCGSHATTVDLVQVVANIKHDELPRKPFKIPTKPRRRERLTFDKAQTPESDNQDMSCRGSWHLHDQIHDQQFSLDPADDIRLSFSSGIMTPTFLNPPGQLRAGKS